MTTESQAPAASLKSIAQPGSSRPETTYAVLNPAYPAAYWQVAISTDVKVGEVIPLHVLERDIVLWRDSAGHLQGSSAHCGHLGAHLGYGGEVVNDTLRCPFHAWRYNASGKVVDIPGIEGRVKTRACLQVYRVIERYGAVFLWNGPSTPDFEMPDALAELGLAEDAVDFVNVRFKLWYSARELLENNPDASHFAGLHGLGTWGDAELVERTDTKMDVIARFYGRTPYPRWSNIKRAYRRGELFGEVVNAITAGDLRSIIYSFGITLYKFAPPISAAIDRDADMKLVPRLLAGATRAAGAMAEKGGYLLSHTPCDSDSQILHATFFVPRVKNPMLQTVANRVVKEVMARVNYFAIWQDGMVMAHRKEPAKPAFHKFDRKLIEQRKFWDERVKVAADAAEAQASPSADKVLAADRSAEVQEM